ncbi:hypothetical protein BDV12DRAFT_35011 [Aspergillus spectabilis]
MSQLLTPASRQASDAPDTELKQLQIDDPTTDPLLSLDSILEKYLHLLDQHQRLQTELASKLSSGFLSLAHANYTCPPGRRYGADYYDERMKATRRVVLQPSSSRGIKEYVTELGGRPQVGTPGRQIFSFDPATSSGEEEEVGASDQSEPSESDERAVTQELSKSGSENGSVKTTATPRDSSGSSEAEPEADTDIKPECVRRRKRILDPIRWYGILVPPSLRNAQKSFTEAIEGSLPKLASIVLEMRAAEKEISRLRGELRRQQ